MSTFTFPQLDAATRHYMIEELETDRDHNRIYIGKRLNEVGRDTYLDTLPTVLEGGMPGDLQRALDPVPGALWVPETIASNGRRSVTPRTAAQTLAEGEFNRYYMRAICRRAIEEGDGRVRVRRGKPVDNPRSDRFVQVNEGDVLDAHAVLDDIRRHPGEDTDLGMPRGPNSGLSLEFQAVQ